MYGEAAYAEIAYADSLPIVPAQTPRGRADQLTQMLVDVPEIHAHGYGLLIERMISEYRRAGNPGKAGERVERFFAENPETTGKLIALIADGKKGPAAKIRRTIAAETNVSLQTVDRVLLKTFQK